MYLSKLSGLCSWQPQMSIGFRSFEPRSRTLSHLSVSACTRAPHEDAPLQQLPCRGLLRDPPKARRRPKAGHVTLEPMYHQATGRPFRCGFLRRRCQLEPMSCRCSTSPKGGASCMYSGFGPQLEGSKVSLTSTAVPGSASISVLTEMDPFD